MARVLVTRRLPGGLDPLVEAGHEVIEPEGDRPFTHGEMVKQASAVDAIVCLLTDQIDDAVLTAGSPRLKVVATVAVGYDNIDLDTSAAHGIAVTNTPAVLDDTTADLAFLLILAASRRIWDAESDLRAGKWPGWDIDQYLGRDVHGAVLGVVGFGRIGQAVARRATGFGMEVPPSAKPVVGPLTLLKRFDRASPKLLLAALTAESLLVEINWFMDQTGQRTVSIVLDGAAITKIDAAAQLDGTSASGFETVSLSYTRITFTSRIIDASGKVSGTVMVCLDVAAGKVC